MKKSIVCFLLLSVFTLSIFPCSIFKYVSGKSIYFCGNEDWRATDPAYTVIPSSKDSYGVLLLGWKSYLPKYPQAGVNSEGLCFDWASVSPQEYIADSTKENLSVDDTLLILQKCSNVSEVLSFLEHYTFSNLASEHLMFADKSGSSCIIEFTKGTRKIISSSENQYITNFNLTDKETGWYPCDRFVKLESKLHQTNTDYSRFDLEQILYSVHSEGAFPTVYSYIIDLTSMKIYLYNDYNFISFKSYKIEDLVKKRITMPIE